VVTSCTGGAWTTGSAYGIGSGYGAISGSTLALGLIIIFLAAYFLGLIVINFLIGFGASYFTSSVVTEDAVYVSEAITDSKDPPEATIA
jgi:hypothetical protein